MRDQNLIENNSVTAVTLFLFQKETSIQLTFLYTIIILLELVSISGEMTIKEPPKKRDTLNEEIKPNRKKPMFTE